ncbi:MAG: dihydroneopterin aldolase [Candidatus Eremiobacteraeota bacterium]|nr:dihydroneopterin aldolase [Candidatus Eremiobacteraeota bacterium]
MDVIELRGIIAHGRHGANPGERDAEQPFEVDLKLELDLGGGERSDDLEQTVDYAKLHADIVKVISDHSYYLLERLAGAIIDEIFRNARVARAEVRVGKPRLLDGATPSVTLKRENPRFTR